MIRTAPLSLLLAILLLPAAPVALAGDPVATVRVSFDRNGVTEVDARGFADREAGRTVTADDPVRIASISKLVAAIGVMRLVEAGKLDLDADAGDLLGFPLRNPAFPDAPITLRMLLSHRSSLTDAAGYWQTPLGGELRSILDDPRAWDSRHPPGIWFRYTNLNFPLVAQAMERATGERFDRLMQRLVLEPLGLDACYNWATCDDATIARAVVIYDGDGEAAKDDLHGARPDCPVIAAEDGSCDLAQWRAGENGALFSPQGGLRISANDLARIGRMLLNGGELDGVRILSPDSVRALATPLWQYAPGDGLTYEEDTGDLGTGFFCRYGMAMQTLATPVEGCRDDPFGDGIARVGHSGSAYGLQSGLWLDLEGGTGVAWFATGMPGERVGGRSAFSAVEEALARGESPLADACVASLERRAAATLPEGYERLAALAPEAEAGPVRADAAVLDVTGALVHASGDPEYMGLAVRDASGDHVFVFDMDLGNQPAHEELLGLVGSSPTATVRVLGTSIPIAGGTSNFDVAACRVVYLLPPGE